MRYNLLSLASLSSAALLMADGAAAQTPVVVELFTSEGCSSCPPADALLSAIRKAAPAEGVEVIALSEHVDYWNQLGWRDPFSSRQFSERQQEYARRFQIRGPYTPQMVVDGRWEFVGSDRGRLEGVLREAAAKPKARVEIVRNGAELAITVPGAADGEAWMAITEDGLATAVKRGENGGRTLRHDGVVRKMARLGKGRRFREAWKPDGTWRGGLRVVVFVTDRNGAVVAAGALGVD
ncbi:MAG: DUF1223 domain-containing protein [Bryobacteraceae bacterium]